MAAGRRHTRQPGRANRPITRIKTSCPNDWTGRKDFSMERLSIIDTSRVPTPDELYEVACFVEDFSVLAFALRGAGIKENEIDSILNVFEKVLGTAAEVLVSGLDTNCGTFSRPADVKKVS